MTLYNRGDCCSERLNNVKVKVGMDSTGKTNDVCGSVEDMGTKNTTKITCCELIPGKYVHVEIPGPQYLSLCEVQVHGYNAKLSKC